MLFELSDELLSAWPTDPSWLHALTNLGRAAHEGKHVVTKTTSLDQIADDLFSEQAEEVHAAWRALCEKVLAWGCALKRHSG